MVQIYIKTAEDQNNELSMIELQGDLSVEDGTGLPSKLMGDLHFTKEGVPLLILGHHCLYGKVVNLDKPLVLLKKNVKKMTPIIDSDDENMDDQENSDKRAEENSEPTTSTEYLISAVIKKKFLFNKRPRPIVYLEAKQA